jgi:hypothetical protein
VVGDWFEGESELFERVSQVAHPWSEFMAMASDLVCQMLVLLIVEVSRSMPT